MTQGFAGALARELRVREGQTARLADVGGDPHSSALTLGYHTAMASGQTRAVDQVLFVAVGAGLTSACAVYRQ
jgi:3-oxoacyl-[acyl-carrier-protein] synthase-3